MVVKRHLRENESGTLWSSFDSFIRKPVQYTFPEPTATSTDFASLIVDIDSGDVDQDVALPVYILSSSLVQVLSSITKSHVAFSKRESSPIILNYVVLLCT